MFANRAHLSSAIPAFLLLFTIFAGGAARAQLLEQNPDCRRDQMDKHEPAMRFRIGKFKGECADTSTVRPVSIESEDTREIRVINYYHEGRFWIASIPRNAVSKAYFQIVPFDSGVPLIKAAHTQFRFILSAPIELKSQNDSRSSRLEDLIVSSTFVAPKGVEYQAKNSLGTGYGMVTRALSSYSRGLEEIVKDKSIVRQFEMILTPAEKSRLLEIALRRASNDAYSQEYGLLNNNCTTLAFDILDDLRPRPPGVPAMRGSIWRLRDEFEGPSIEALKARGLINDSSEVQPMNDERKWE